MILRSICPIALETSSQIVELLGDEVGVSWVENRDVVSIDITVSGTVSGLANVIFTEDRATYLNRTHAVPISGPKEEMV